MGAHPSREGGSFYQKGGQKIGKKGRREKFLSIFLEIFGKFVNENTIQSGFCGGLGRNTSTITKIMLIFREKILLPTANKFEILLPRCQDPSPSNSPLVALIWYQNW